MPVGLLLSSPGKMIGMQQLSVYKSDSPPEKAEMRGLAIDLDQTTRTALCECCNIDGVSVERDLAVHREQASRSSGNRGRGSSCTLSPVAELPSLKHGTQSRTRDPSCQREWILLNQRQYPAFHFNTNVYTCTDNDCTMLIAFARWRYRNQSKFIMSLIAI